VDRVTLIAAALVGGAAAGAHGAAGAAVRDAYDALRALIRSRLSAHPDGVAVLEARQVATEAWQAELIRVIDDAGLDADDDTIDAAQRVMELLDPSGSRAGRYRVDARGAQGLQVGDRDVQHNQF